MCRSECPQGAGAAPYAADKLKRLIFCVWARKRLMVVGEDGAPATHVKATTSRFKERCES